MVPKIGRSDAPTLITGSTGTGKEHLARAIHAGSPRSRRPFVAINCAAIPDALFESELFGFERGSFTGASQARKGKAALADGGTLFLDEIGELPPYSQTKLLRVLEDHEVHPIGASRPVHVDLRIVAATNADVERALAAGNFRKDLYYRINVARVAIPDLAERPEDIPLYLDHFVAQLNHRHGMCVGSADCELLELLLKYDWPGNVREVRNFVEGVFIDPPSGAIDVNHIPAAFAHLGQLYTRTGEEERRRIIAALERTNWNKLEAARELRWSRMTLYRKLTKYKVSRGGGPPRETTV
jgi:two-component system response regulator HydG